jgi:CelD/BcsL family acetyltransferase involved in cellulose biosynthesis
LEATLHQDQVGKLLPEWAELFAADDRATPFQSPGWARAWWRYWARGSRPWLLAVRDAGSLVGLAPLRSHRLLGLRLLRVNGEPGDYWEVLARPECRTAVEEVIGRELQCRQREWDVLVVSQLPHCSSTAGALEGAGLRAAHRSAIPCPTITLPDSFDAYLATLPTSRRTNLRRRLRNLDKGELELRVPTVPELPLAIGRWQELRVRQWAAMGKRISREHTRARFRDFLVEVTTELVPAGLALVWEFVRGREVVGSFINFCDARAFYQYLGGFAPELGHLAIGKVATAEGIRSSIAAGRSCYDFMRGSEPYKYWYGAVDRLSPTVVLTGGRVRSLLAGRLSALVPGLRS